MAENNRLTHRWLVGLLLSVLAVTFGLVGILVGRWADWVTAELHESQRVRAQRIAELEEQGRRIGDHESRLRALERRPDRP